jgi:hypothetical protein
LGGTGWDLEIKDDGFSSFTSSNKVYVDITQESITYKVSIEAIDDPSDSDELLTKDPVKEIKKFLSKGVPGGESVFKQGFSPDRMVSALSIISSFIADNLIKRRSNIVRLVKRIAVLPNLHMVRAVVSSFRVSISEEVRWDSEYNELFSIKKDLKRQGWTISEHKSEIDKPMLEINIQDLYEVKIEVDSVNYKYKFGVEGYPDSIEKGVSKDPIRAIRDWVKSKKYVDISKDGIGHGSTVPSKNFDQDKTKPPTSDTDKTKPPGK